VALTVLLTLTTAAVASAAPGPKFNPPRSYYLALGDSYANGLQPAKWSAGLPPSAFNTGYVDGSGEQRLTNNNVGDTFGTLSPDGKKIAFDSNRNRLDGESLNTSGLFVMNADGTDQTFLARGGSPS
jgi:WD40-like Beta Propeller Repeat